MSGQTTKAVPYDISVWNTLFDAIDELVAQTYQAHGVLSHLGAGNLCSTA
jgi:hypothetical protein